MNAWDANADVMDSIPTSANAVANTVGMDGVCQPLYQFVRLLISQAATK